MPIIGGDCEFPLVGVSRVFAKIALPTNSNPSDSIQNSAIALTIGAFPQKAIYVRLPASYPPDQEDPRGNTGTVF